VSLPWQPEQVTTTGMINSPSRRITQFGCGLSRDSAMRGSERPTARRESHADQAFFPTRRMSTRIDTAPCSVNHRPREKVVFPPTNEAVPANLILQLGGADIPVYLDCQADRNVCPTNPVIREVPYLLLANGQSAT